MRDHKKVVILFRNPRGLDDRAMAAVMRSVDQRTKAVVLTDDVAAVERYGKLVEDLGVSQTPSVVIIDRSGTRGCSKASQTPTLSPKRSRTRDERGARRVGATRRTGWPHRP